MILPFVREMIADLEHTDSFERLRRHLSGGLGRRRVSGLTATARALYLPLMVRASNAPALILVSDNKAAEALHSILNATCELTGALRCEEVLRLPAHDVLPFENLSPHAEIQEQRASTLWKVCSGAARVVIAPLESACMRLFNREYYAGLALEVKTGEEYDTAMLLEHLLTVGYTRVDVVEMPGQVTLRGGIMDVYSPEMDRPVRIDFFGDEIETMRKFDPETQRSSAPVDEITLLPLTETPVTDKLLGAVHARLVRGGTAGGELEGGEEPREMASHVGNVSVFPGWEFFAPVAGAHSTILELMGPKTRVYVEEPAMVKNQGERWWNKIEQRHDRSGIGNLVKPDDIYLSPWDLDDRVRRYPGIDLDQLGAVDVLDAEQSTQSEIEFASRPTMRFHGSIPAFTEQLKTLQQADARVLIAAANQGEVERLAGLLQEYGVPYRIGSRVQQASGSATVYDEASYLTGDIRTPVIVKAALANGVQFLDLEKATARQLIVIGAHDLTDEADVNARPVQRKSKTSAFISDFRDLTVGDFVVHVEHGIAQYMGLRTLDQDGAPFELMILEFAEQAKLYVPLTRLDLIQKYRSSEAGPAPELNRMGGAAWAKTKARVKKAMQDMAGELLKLYAQRQAALGHAFTPDTQMHARVRRCLRLQRNRRPAFGHRGHQARHGIDPANGPPAVRRRRLRQDGSGDARGAESRAGFEAGSRSNADNRAQLSALSVVQKALCALSREHRNDLQLPHREGAKEDPRRHCCGQSGHSHRHAPAAVEGPQLPGSRLARGR